MPDKQLPFGKLQGRTLLTARWVVGHEAGQHVILPGGEVVLEDDQIIFVGYDFAGDVPRRVAFPHSVLAPGFIDLDALSDLDTGTLSIFNQPSWRKGRVWPKSYMAHGPYEMYSSEELAFQKRYAFAHLIRNGITTVLPIASLFYRQWSETYEEFSAAASEAADLGLRVYLGPAYRAGYSYVDDNGTVGLHFDEDRGLAGLAEAIRFCHNFEGRSNGLIRTMLAPDRVESCTETLLRRTAAAAEDLDVPVRLHCCQSSFEVDEIFRQHGVSPAQWLTKIGFLSDRCLLPHATHVSGPSRNGTSSGDLVLFKEAGATIVHCPAVMARHGSALNSFSRCLSMNIRLGLGTDTWPPDIIYNMQVGLMLCRVMDESMETVGAEQFFDAATLGGAAALGRDDLGRIAVGAKADLIVIDLGQEHFGQITDPIQAIMLCGSGRDVRTVFIDGRVVMRDGVIPGFNPAEAHRKAQRQFEGLIAKYPDRTFGHPPAETIFRPTYRHVRNS
jgi:cytosine/adenosine deaminase-related metal-dependent hydrolase